MNTKRKMYWIAALSGMIGASVGSVSGNNSLLITSFVGIGIALLVAWGLDEMLK